MKINQNRPETKQVPVNVINTMLEQISNLQTDVATLQNEVDGFDQSVDTVNIEATQAAIDAINATNISSTNATINNITASGNVDIANLDANTADIDTATIGTETVGTSNITDATIATANITDLDTVNGAVQHLSAGNIEADSVDADTITTEGITNSGDYTGKDATLSGDLSVSGSVETGSLRVHGDIDVNGQILTAQEIIGARDLLVVNLQADDSNLVRAEVGKLGVNEEYLREVNALVPSPSLVSDSDRYTIELPRFTGVMKLVWMDSAYQWTATVIGNGRDYCVTWSSYAPNEMYITQLFQWAGHLYIRHRANGKLYYSYSAEREITQSINIYYNMGAWPYPKSLEILCDEHHKVDVTRPDGTVWFGAIKLPMLEKNEGGSLVFKGSTVFSGLPSFSDVIPGDVWNISNEALTDNRFIEGAGRPINAGDDIVAVEVEETSSDLERNNSSIFDRADDTPVGVSDLCVIDNNNLFVSVTPVYSESNTKSYIGFNNEWNLIDFLIFGPTFKASNGNLISYAPTYDLEYTVHCYSTDNGNTWHWSDGEISNGTGRVIENNGRLFEADAYSDDFGITWQRATNAGYPVALNDSTILRISELGSIYKSTDNGINFISIGDLEIDNISYKLYSNPIYVDNTIIAVVNDDNYNNYLVTSSDEGSTWVLGATLQNDSCQLHLINNKIIIVDYENGIYTTEDNGETLQLFIDLKRVTNITSLNSVYYISQSGDYSIDEDGGLYTYNTTTGKVLKWDKFAAGVNYANFTAGNIVATDSLKSNGTFEVAGESTFRDNITHTGNLSRTGNETIIGTVTIGDLD